MAIKRNSELTIQKIIRIAAPLFAVLLCLRTVHTFILTDYETGFFKSGGFFSVSLYFILAVFIAGVMALCYISGSLPSADKPVKPKIFNIAAGFFFAISMAIDGIDGIKAMLGAAADGFAAMKEAAGGNIGFFASIFAALGAVAILLHTVSQIKSDDLTGKFSILLLAPVVWAFLRTLGFFSITVSYIKVSQLFLSIFSVAFLMVFLFENARMSTGIGRKNSVWFFYASGIITAVFCLITGLPSLVQAIFAPENQISYCPFELYTLGGGIYALSSIVMRMNVKEENKEEIAEEIQINDVTENG